MPGSSSITSMNPAFQCAACLQPLGQMLGASLSDHAVEAVAQHRGCGEFPHLRLDRDDHARLVLRNVIVLAMVGAAGQLTGSALQSTGLRRDRRSPRSVRVTEQNLVVPGR